MLFIKNNFYCILQRDEGEPYEHFIERGYFVAGLAPKNNEEYYKYITYSRIYTNIKYYHCKYNDNIMSETKELTDRSITS